MIKLFFAGCIFSLLTLPVMAQNQDTTMYLAGSRFVDGFARVKKDSITSFYIDTTGKRAFDKILKPSFYSSQRKYHFHTPGTPFYKSDSLRLPTNFVRVQKDEKEGVLTDTGQWLLHTKYDTINTRFQSAWRITKNGKQAYYGPSGFLLPFRFDSVNYLDGRRFDVKKGDHWGVYDAQDDKMIIPPKYQGFDYCGGCEAKGNYVFAKKNDKWGIVNFGNDVLIPFEYEHHHINMRSDEKVLSLYKNGKPMIINLNTGVIRQKKKVNSTHKIRVDTMAQGFVRKRKNGKWGMFNAAGKQILPYAYDYIIYKADSTGYHLPAPFVGLDKDEKQGIADTTGTIIVPTSYDDWFQVRYGRKLFTSDRNGQPVVLNHKGQPVLPKGVQDIGKMVVTDPGDSSKVELLTYKQDSLYGFYNPISKNLIKPQYTKLKQNYGALKEYIKAWKDDSVGLINANGQTIIPQQYEHLYSYTSDFPNLVKVTKKGQKGYYNIREEKEVVPTSYDQVTIKIYGNEKPVIFLTKEHHTGIATINGKMIIPVAYSNILSIDTTHFLLIKKGKQPTYSVFESQEGKTYALPKNDGVRIAHEGSLLVLFVGNKAKLYDAATQKVIKGAYSKNGFPTGLSTFYHHRAQIKKHHDFGYINPQGDLLIRIKYHSISSFQNGLARVTLKRLATNQLSYGYIDSTDHIVVPIKYDDLPDAYSDEYFKDPYLVLYKLDNDQYNYLLGYASQKGKIVIPPEYTKIYPSKSGDGFLVKKDGKFGILNGKGKVMVPVEYDNIMLDNRIRFSGGKAEFGFPLLCAKKDYWEYVQANRTVVPVRVKNHIPFTPSLY